MEYACHAEHQAFRTVPFHQLPSLHEVVHAPADDVGRVLQLQQIVREGTTTLRPPTIADRRIEWPTLFLIAGCYACWGLVSFYASEIGLLFSVPILGVAVALHSSLQHEVLHGHPFLNRKMNEALVFSAVNVAIPYLRFRDTHLAHHHCESLTDPYDDPESNYLDPSVWSKLPAWRRAVFSANNMLLGRMLVGPLLGLIAFYRAEVRDIGSGNTVVIRAWIMHALGLGPIVLWLSLSSCPLWAYLVAVYFGLSLLKVRTFLEHRAYEKHTGRSVIIEDGGPLSLLFLNNNFHAVHHTHPSVPWYKLPDLYWSSRDFYLHRNGGYRYPSYWSVFRNYSIKAKDPVPHPRMDTK